VPGAVLQEDTRRTPPGHLLSDGVTIVAFLVLEPGQEHPLRTFPAYVELLENFGPWRAEPATADLMTVLGSYRLF
jgi:hypothetical protein